MDREELEKKYEGLLQLQRTTKKRKSKRKLTQQIYYMYIVLEERKHAKRSPLPPRESLNLPPAPPIMSLHSMLFEARAEESAKTTEAKPVATTSTRIDQSQEILLQPKEEKGAEPTAKAIMSTYAFGKRLEQELEQLDRSSLVDLKQPVTDENSPLFLCELLSEGLLDDSKLSLQGASGKPQPFHEDCLHLLSTGAYANSYLTATLTFTPKETEKILTQDREREAFIADFRRSLALGLKIREEDIQVISLARGSIKVNFLLKNGGNATASVVLGDATAATLKAKYGTSYGGIIPHPLILSCALSWKSFDPAGNRGPHDFARSIETRGREPYVPPPTGLWKGYGLCVTMKYGSDDWLAMNGNANEWAVGYIGFTSQKDIKTFYTQPSTVATVNSYQFDKDRLTGQPCGVGIVVYQDLSECETKMCTTPLWDKNKTYKYNVAFMNRFNPKTAKRPLSNPRVYLLPNIADIRPYRILLRKLP